MVGRKTESKIGTCGERSPVRSYDATVAELIDRITDPLIVLNPNCEVTFVNAAASNLIAGILDDDTRSIIGNGVVNLFSPTVSAMLVDIVERCHANHSTIQRRYYWPKLERWYSAHAYPLRDGAALRLHDISDLKLAEERQQEAETRFRTLVERVPSTMYIAAIDELSSTIYLSPQIEMLLGYTTDEWLSNPRSWLDALHPDERDRVIEEITPRSNNDDLHSEYRLRHRDGHFVWVRDQATLVLDDAGNPLHWQGFLLDISEQKRAQENLVELGQKYRLLVDSANDFIIAYGLDARLTFVNCLFLQHFGYTLDEALEFNRLRRHSSGRHPEGAWLLRGAATRRRGAWLVSDARRRARWLGDLYRGQHQPDSQCERRDHRNPGDRARRVGTTARRGASGRE